ncbi:MAG: trimethylamine methyltransferase family protein [Anaerolineales bacterium]|nr:trimethylamine methyltransferase family protein [Anaerolineales bacterium]
MDKESRTARRAAQRQSRSQSPLLKIPFQQIRHQFTPLETVSAEQVEQLHLASLRILEEIGLDFLDDEALDLWQKAGAKVDRSTRHVWLDRHLVLELVAQAPSTFTWRARNPERSLAVGGDTLIFAPHGGTVFAANLDIGRRPGLLKDYHNLQKLAQMCNLLHTSGEQLMVAHDVEVSARHLHRLLSGFTLTDKAIQEAAHGRIIPNDALAMARLVFGDDLGSDPVLAGVINVNSPLRYDDRMLGGLLTYARAGQITIITPFILAGAMSPITIAAALVQQNAEALAGIALTQLVRPGAPVIYGGFTTNVDMKSGSPAFGTPEGAWALVVGAQLARHYNLPYRGSGSLNTSKTPDAQAAYETLWTLWPAILARTNFVMHAIGWLEGGLTASYEKFIIDAENLAMFAHFLRGFEINEDTLALDMIAEVGPGGHHFGTTHTQARFSTEFYESFLADRLSYQTWREAGAFDTAKRANLVWKELLNQYQPPPIDPGLAEALQDFVARRERELAGVELYS